MGDFTIYNVSSHNTAERLSAREQAVVADLCEGIQHDDPQGRQREDRALFEARSGLGAATRTGEV
jgi:hypothetical protein